MYITPEGFFQVAIESWPEWDLSPRPLKSFQWDIYIYTYIYIWFPKRFSLLSRYELLLLEHFLFCFNIFIFLYDYQFLFSF